MGQRYEWSGSIFVVCFSCRRPTISAELEGWRFYNDVDGNPHGFCARCSDEEFGDAVAAPPPRAVCPRCEAALHPQPLGGWVCDVHGLIVAPKV